MHALTTVAGITVTVGLVVGLLGVGLLHLLRRRPLLDQLLASTAVAAAAVVVTVLLEVRARVVAGSGVAAVLLALAVGLGLASFFAWRVTRQVTTGLLLVMGHLRELAPADPTPSWAVSSQERGRDSQVALPRELDQLRTELVEVAANLAAAREREHLAEEARRELITFLSHDLRTPLAGLRALTEGLEDGVIDDVPRALGHLRTTVERMSGLVEDLFSLTRSQGPREVRHTVVSLSELLVDVASEVATIGAGRRVQVTTDLPAGDSLAVLGVPGDLTRALMNLVTNALRHTDAGAAVTLVGRRAEDGRIQVAVVDRCGGIPEQHLPLVFGTGWRGGVPSTDDGGAGLGLAIARGVVHSHLGRLTVRNVEGGCRFEVDLPARQAGLSPSPTPLS